MVGLSDKDLERIKEFNETPWYAKNPEILLPKGDDDGTSHQEVSD